MRAHMGGRGSANQRGIDPVKPLARFRRFLSRCRARFVARAAHGGARAASDALPFVSEITRPLTAAELAELRRMGVSAAELAELQAAAMRGPLQ